MSSDGVDRLVLFADSHSLVEVTIPDGLNHLRASDLRQNFS